MAHEHRYGVSAEDVRCLNEAQITEIVAHIMTMEPIWSRLSHIRADQWIDEDLGSEIRGEIDRYARDRGWRVGAHDFIGGYGPIPIKPNIISLLRQKAEESQERR